MVQVARSDAFFEKLATLYGVVIKNCWALRRLERVFRCYIVCETMKDYKEGCLMVGANYMSPWNSIVGLLL